MTKLKSKVQKLKSHLWQSNSIALQAKLEFGENGFQVSLIKKLLPEFIRTISELSKCKALYGNRAISEVDSDHLINMRGRPLATIPQEIESKERSSEELLFLSGDFIEPTLTENQTILFNNLKNSTFIFKVNSIFEYSEKGNIIFKINTDSSGISPQALAEISFSNIIENDCFYPKSARFGFERYRHSYISHYLGLSPAIFEILYLSIDKSGLEIYAKEDNVKKDQLLPFVNEGYLEFLSQNLEFFGIFSGFYNELESNALNNNL